MSSVQELSSDAISEVATQNTAEPPTTPATSIQEASSQARSLQSPKTPPNPAVKEAENAEKDAQDDYGYTTEEEAEAVYIIWKAGQHGKKLREAERQAHRLSQRGLQISNRRLHPGAPRADTSNLGQWLPITRETQPEAFRPLPEQHQNNIQASHLEAEIRTAMGRVRDATLVAARVRRERRRLWQARDGVRDLQQVDNRIENVERMISKSAEAEDRDADVTVPEGDGEANAHE